MATTSSSEPNLQELASARAARSAQNAWSGILFGVGIVAFVDEAVFHQLLHWHHFYDLSTPDIGLVSDGIFHAISWFATIAGLFLFADLRRRGALWAKRWWGGVLVGAGAFQLYDGTVQHKLLGIHQIRYVPDLLTYDLVWNITAVVMLVAGAILLTITRRSAISSS
ncbi:DUF2243 domain-containing protein [Mycetocola zhadangensis]|uniref:DUF2243 domain-containing protein n=1 Tax=Mycetocola zhadangensis TaxID=1164595 RepID=A0A3L7J3J6_9MICO|nr:DUF2243 domain-containing protein [Mycetocola zhadangensis]RLQ84011.1 DUF2243 domain-containing protein [Mycetocola zhadangensis]GGE96902.1 membrane protein [Mycetocola zhadangensis]